MTRAEARRREETFLERFRSQAARIRELFHPAENRYYPVAPSDLPPRERDGGEALRRAMDRLGLADRSVLGEMPRDRSLRVEVGTRGFLGRGQRKLAVVAQSLSPMDALLRDADPGGTEAPVTLAALREAIGEIVREPGVFYYVGVCATTRFAPECAAEPPVAPNLLLARVERDGGTSWRVALGDPDRWRGLAECFDPESGDEKVARCRRAIEERTELRLRGGHVLLEDLHRAPGFAREIVERAIESLVSGNGAEWLVRDVGERKILQRARFPAERSAK
ncbi:MAG: hypothetical protein L0216_21950 [Planctomycetales bacterium]|nr:hypothetical protein [Planctomycetales bacterium]